MKILISTLLNISILSSLLFCGMMKPTDGQFISYIHVLFEWDQEPDANLYNIQISQNSQFTNLILDLNTPDLTYIYKDYDP